MTCTQHTRCNPATLPDGRETCTWSEDWKLHCEALHVCSLPTLLDRRQYLMKIQHKRGDKAWLQLRTAVELAWNNRPAGGGK